MARPNHTILLLTASRVARADFAGAPGLSPVGLWIQRASGGRGLPALAAEALALGPACGRHVWILAEGIWTQKLSLSQQAAVGLSTEELTKALSFEVEPLSGIPADQSSLGVVAAGPAEGGEGRDYWIVQMPEDVVTELAELVRRAGGKLSSVGHPGGLGALVRPASFPGQPGDEETGGGWRRIEVWQQATLFVTGGHGRPGGVHIINSSSEQPSWQRWVQRWVTTTNASHSEWLGDLDPELYLSSEAMPENWMRVGLGAEADAGAFLQTWMRHLTAEVPGVPLIRPQPRKAGRREFVRLGVMLEFAALLLVGAHAGALNWYQQRTATHLREVQSESRQMADLTSQIGKMQSQLAEFDLAHRADAKAGLSLETTVEHLRKRLFHALTELAAARPAGLVLQRITTKGNGELVVQGVASEADLPDRYAVALSRELRGDGMVVAPAEKNDQGWSEAGGPWSLSITLGIQPAASAATKPAVASHPGVHATPGAGGRR